MSFLKRLFMSKAERAQADLEEALFPGKIYSAAYEKTKIVDGYDLHGQYCGQVPYTTHCQMAAIKNKYDKTLYDLFIIQDDRSNPVTINGQSDSRVTLEGAKSYIDLFEKDRINEGYELSDRQPHAKKIVSTRFQLNR